MSKTVVSLSKLFFHQQRVGRVNKKKETIPIIDNETDFLVGKHLIKLENSPFPSRI